MAGELIIVAPEAKPLYLQRPSSDGAIAELDYVAKPSDDDEGPSWDHGLDLRGDPRWRITGSPVVVVAAMKLFSGAVSKKRGTVSFPASEGVFEDLLMLMHRYPMRLTPDAQAEWERQYLAAVLRADGGAAPIQRRRGSFK